MSKALKKRFFLTMTKSFVIMTNNFVKIFAQGALMSAQQPKRPTDAELNILNILWELGPCTVRQVHKALNRTAATGYTTALKLLQIMTEKGLVLRDASERPRHHARELEHHCAFRSRRHACPREYDVNARAVRSGLCRSR
jgi:hypothetical protein